MIRILIFIFGALFVAFLATILAGVDGRVTAEAFGRRYDIHTGFALGALLLTIAGAYGLAGALKDLGRVRENLKNAGARSRREKGLEALTRGFEAVAIGDGGAAMKQARIAQRNLEDAGVTRLLTAQAAQLAGDEAAARQSFTAMLAAPESEFLGLRGLFIQAERKGDQAAQRELADKAFRLKPGAPWAFATVFDAALERGAWREARDILAAGARSGALARDRAERAEAALLVADAHATAAAGDAKSALEEARRALRIAEGFTPAATLAARLLSSEGKRGKALKVLDRAYEIAPHIAIVDAYSSLYSGDEAPRRAGALDALASRAPDAAPSVIARAAARLSAGDAAGVAAILEPVLKTRATARVCALMAEAAAAAGSSVSDRSAREWLKRAALAPRDFEPAGDSGFDLARPGWARLIREYMDYARLAPPTLEIAERGVSEEEIKRLDFRVSEAPPQPVEEAAPPAQSTTPSPPKEEAAKSQSLAGDAVSAARAVAAAGEVS